MFCHLNFYKLNQKLPYNGTLNIFLISVLCFTLKSTQIFVKLPVKASKLDENIISSLIVSFNCFWNSSSNSARFSYIDLIYQYITIIWLDRRRLMI